MGSERRIEEPARSRRIAVRHSPAEAAQVAETVRQDPAAFWKDPHEHGRAKHRDTSSPLPVSTPAPVIVHTTADAKGQLGFGFVRDLPSSDLPLPLPPPHATGPARKQRGGRFLLACGIHTAAHALDVCPACAQAAEETAARLDEVMAGRGHAVAGAKGKATKIERYGSARGPAVPPKFNAVTIREARERKAREQKKAARETKAVRETKAAREEKKAARKAVAG